MGWMDVVERQSPLLKHALDGVQSDLKGVVVPAWIDMVHTHVSKQHMNIPRSDDLGEYGGALSIREMTTITCDPGEVGPIGYVFGISEFPLEGCVVIVGLQQYYGETHKT